MDDAVLDQIDTLLATNARFARESSDSARLAQAEDRLAAFRALRQDARRLDWLEANPGKAGTLFVREALRDRIEPPLPTLRAAIDDARGGGR